MPKVKNVISPEKIFYDCVNLESVEFPSLSSVGMGMFKNCVNLREISLPSATEIDDNAFTHCISLKRAVLPSAKTIGTKAFSRCTSLEEVIAPEAETIDDEAFSTCIYIKAINLPRALTIEDASFMGCLSLAEAVMPLAESVGYDAFKGCASLETVEMPSLLHIGSGSFRECRITTLNVHPEAVAEYDSFDVSAPKNCPEIGGLHERAMMRELEDLEVRAEAGNMEAQYELGCVYETGRLERFASRYPCAPLVWTAECFTPDINEAIELWQKSSAQEYPPAMFRLAKEYAEGTNIHQDSREAVRLWEKAAGSGNDDAMLYLGMAFEGGRLTEKNINEARRYYRMAVRKFNAEALRHLIRLNGSCPETGSAMPEDETEATYFKAEHGDVKAIYRLAKTCEEIYEDEDKRLALVRLASDLKKGRH